MALPTYNEFSTPEQNLLLLLAAQATPNPPSGQQVYGVISAKAILNLFAVLQQQAAAINALAQAPAGDALSIFLKSLNEVGVGILVKRSSGMGGATKIASDSDALSVTGGDGSLSEITLSLSARLKELDSVSFTADWMAYVSEGASLKAKSLKSASIGQPPITLADGDTYTVLDNTQVFVASEIGVDGELVIDGLLNMG